MSHSFSPVLVKRRDLVCKVYVIPAVATEAFALAAGVFFDGEAGWAKSEASGSWMGFRHNNA